MLFVKVIMCDIGLLISKTLRKSIYCHDTIDF